MLRRDSSDKENAAPGQPGGKQFGYPEAKQNSGRTSPYLLRATPPKGAPKVSSTFERQVLIRFGHRPTWGGVGLHLSFRMNHPL